MKRRYVILLTSCVNPNGMPFTALSDINVRKQQYLEALSFYVYNTSLPIVYVDNSNVNKVVDSILGMHSINLL